MEKFIVTTGKTIDLAVTAALQQLGMDRDSVSVEILETPKSGFFGIGASPAKVKLTYEAPDEPAAPVEAPTPEPVADITCDGVFLAFPGKRPIRHYAPSGALESSPQSPFSYTALAARGDELFLGTRCGTLHRHSFSDRGKATLARLSAAGPRANPLAVPRERYGAQLEANPMVTFHAADFAIASVVVVPDSTRVVLATTSGKVLVYDAAQNTLVGSLKGPQATVRLVANAAFVVGCCLDRWVYIWDARSLSLVAKIFAKAYPSGAALQPCD